MRNKKAFTLIEMLVTITIVVIIAASSVISLGMAKKNTSSTTGADELKSLIEELKSFAAGPERELASHYILIVWTSASGSGTYCKGNTITQNQYIICATTKETPTNLTTDFNRVRADRLPSGIVFAGPSNPIVYTVRALDGQMGYGSTLLYPESVGFVSTEQSITITKDEFSSIVEINPLLGTVKSNENI